MMTVSLHRDVVMTEVDEGLVLLDQRNGRYWHLNGTAGRMLRDLLDGHSPEQTAARITGTTGSPGFQTQVTEDVRAFLDGLVRARLVAQEPVRTVRRGDTS